MEPLGLNISLGACNRQEALSGRVTRNEWGRRRGALCLRLEMEAPPAVIAGARRCLEDRYGAVVSTSTGPDADGMVWLRAVIDGRALGVFE